MTTTFYQNPYLPHSLRTGTQAPLPKQRLVQVATDNAGLPIGTAAQVMEWVGDDPERAQAFLTKEQRETRPRVSLVANLKAVLKRHDVKPVEVIRPAQLAPQIDVIPAERAAVIEGEVVTDDPPIVNQLEAIRDRLKTDAS